MDSKDWYLPTVFPPTNFTDELILLSSVRSGDFESKGLVGFVGSKKKENAYLRSNNESYIMFLESDVWH